LKLTLTEHFEAQVRLRPQSIAVREGKLSMSFEELETRANSIANALSEQGVGQGDYVGLHIERSIDWVVGVLGILKANAAVVPLPPSYPHGRLKQILAYADLKLVIDHVKARLDSSLTSWVEDFSEISSSVYERKLPDAAQEDQPAFVLCSSGSTAQPKMIVRSHRSFFHRLNWTLEQHPFVAEDVCCQKAHMTTTHAIYELFEPLLGGCEVVIIADEDVRDLERFWDIVRRNGVSRLLIVPSALQASLAIPGFSAPSLDVVVLMGEYVTTKLAEQAIKFFPEHTTLYSIYGSTEASSTLVCNLRESVAPNQEVPLGRPISSDVRILVLNSERKPVAPGSTGRLYISGAALFSEYFKDPDLTSSILFSTPEVFGPIYDTRDDVRLLADGNLHFRGRADHTVKIRGFRVDLPEVERAILSHPKVNQAAVILDSEEEGNSKLLAFYTPASVARNEVFETLREHLPAYMIPSYLLGLEEFPLTDSAKVDRRRLLEGYSSDMQKPRTGRAASELEGKVQSIWQEVLGHSNFGFDSSFFEVGGTSLTVFWLVLQLRESLNLGPDQVSDQVVYSYPTIKEFTAYLKSMHDTGAKELNHRTRILVTLRKGTEKTQPPLFMVAAAGGTLGAYSKLVETLATTREIVGVRDPFVSGERDPTEGFQVWVDLYMEAIVRRQSAGPYYICAYSSAGVFGYEIARRLRQNGQKVALLTLIEPVGIDSSTLWKFGRWIILAMPQRRLVRSLVRFAAPLRTSIIRIMNSIWERELLNDTSWSDDDYRQFAKNALCEKSRVMTLSSQLELNTGLPVALEESDFSGASEAEYFGILQSRVENNIPGLDRSTLKNISVQYEFQTSAQRAYQLGTYDSPVLIVAAASPIAGLLAAQLRPYVKNLTACVLKLGPASGRTREICERLGHWESHFRSMRDDTFVMGLAAELDPLLE
jgi:amino acid adenylation domain-containing protein